MIRRFVVRMSLTLCVALLYLPARAETAAQAFASGQTALAKGDLKAAMLQFGKAARADLDNPQYVQHYAMVRQVIALRDSLPKQTDLDQWSQTARSLHAFYISRKMYQDALALDRQVHAKLQTGGSAVTLAETALAMNRTGEAVEVLAKLEPDRQSATTKAMHALALARDGKADAAREMAKNLSLPSDAGPGLLYTAARLHAATGQADEAYRLLAQCLENLPPSQSEGFKEHAQLSVEFASLAETAGFKQALQTKSKIAESPCSGGSKCSTCPMRGNCAKPE